MEKKCENIKAEVWHQRMICGVCFLIEGQKETNLSFSNVGYTEILTEECKESYNTYKNVSDLQVALALIIRID